MINFTNIHHILALIRLLKFEEMQQNITPLAFPHFMRIL